MKPLSTKRHVLPYARNLLLAASFCLCGVAWAQNANPQSSADASQHEGATVSDPLGRTTPRGTVLGFLAAAGAGDLQTATQYLNTRQRGEGAVKLAQQLAFVLDRRLPAKLNILSNQPEGSLSDPLDHRRELVGSIVGTNGKVDIYLERIDRGGKAGLIWLFSRQTLGYIPDLYEEVNAVAIANVLPDFLLRRFLGISYFGWLFVFVVIPATYCLLSLLDWGLGSLSHFVLQKIRQKQLRRPKIIPPSLRLLLLALLIRWFLSRFSLSLLTRQFLGATSTVIAIVACVWLFILFDGRCEAHLRKRLERRGRLGTATILHPARRVVDFLAMVVGLLIGLHVFGMNIGAALAGLGVGGIAVALAAQKTLENVIGGVSLIMDEAVRVGDFMKVGDVLGTVEEIGLRSTRVRTLDRTLVTVPNAQMASVVLENFSPRDSFWLHHVVRLQTDTTASVLASALEEIRRLLLQDKRVQPSSVRVRFIRFGASSLDLEIVAYVSARDWSEFLEVQEQLLLQIKELLASKGAQIAVPARIVRMRNDEGDEVAVRQSLGNAAGEPGTSGVPIAADLRISPITSPSGTRMPEAPDGPQKTGTRR